MKHRILFLTLAVSAAALAKGTYYQYDYQFNFNPDVDYTISQVYILEARNAPDYSYSYGFRDGGFQVQAPFGGTVTDYPDILTAPATQTLILAVATDPVDSSNHLLMAMDDTAATYTAGQDFSYYFSNTNESDLITDLENYENSDPTVTQNALQGLVDFAYGDATYGITDSNNNSVSAWFDPGQSAPFTLMTWSNGAVVGSGTVTYTQSVPEPAPVAALAIGTIGLFMRRRRK